MPRARSVDVDARADGSRAVERVSQVIQFLSSSPRRGQGSLDVASHLGISRQAASRLLEGMVKGGIASRDPLTRRYRLSMQPFIWFRRVALDRAPTEIIRREMITLAGETSSVIIYGILDGPIALGLEEAECTEEFAILRPSTNFAPWMRSLTGRTLVAFSEPETLQEYLGESGLPAKSDVLKLEKDLEVIRQRGFGKYEENDAFRVAVPIKDSDGLAFASLLLIPPGKNLADEEKQRLAALAAACAERCSASRGTGDLLAI